MKNTARQPTPAARKEGLLVRELGDELLVYDLDSHKAHCLNSTAALVWRSCDGQTQISNIAQAIQSASGGSLDDDAVWLGIAQLTRADLMKTASAGEPVSSKLSRRELIKRAGIAAAVTLPLVTSIITPTPVEAATCGNTGAPCTTNAQCCSNNCLGLTTCA